jgi:hypothetical protein
MLKTPLLVETSARGTNDVATDQEPAVRILHESKGVQSSTSRLLGVISSQGRSDPVW